MPEEIQAIRICIIYAFRARGLVFLLDPKQPESSLAVFKELKQQMEKWDSKGNLYIQEDKENKIFTHEERKYRGRYFSGPLIQEYSYGRTKSKDGVEPIVIKLFEENFLAQLGQKQPFQLPDYVKLDMVDFDDTEDCRREVKQRLGEEQPNDKIFCIDYVSGSNKNILIVLPPGPAAEFQNALQSFEQNELQTILGKMNTNECIRYTDTNLKKQLEIQRSLEDLGIDSYPFTAMYAFPKAAHINTAYLICLEIKSIEIFSPYGEDAKLLKADMVDRKNRLSDLGVNQEQLFSGENVILGPEHPLNVGDKIFKESYQKLCGKDDVDKHQLIRSYLQPYNEHALTFVIEAIRFFENRDNSHFSQSSAVKAKILNWAYAYYGPKFIDSDIDKILLCCDKNAENIYRILNIFEVKVDPPITIDAFTAHSDNKNENPYLLEIYKFYEQLRHPDQSFKQGIVLLLLQNDDAKVSLSQNHDVKVVLLQKLMKEYYEVLYTWTSQKDKDFAREFIKFCLSDDKREQEIIRDMDLYTSEWRLHIDFIDLIKHLENQKILTSQTIDILIKNFNINLEKIQSFQDLQGKENFYGELNNQVRKIKDSVKTEEDFINFFKKEDPKNPTGFLRKLFKFFKNSNTQGNGNTITQSTKR